MKQRQKARNPTWIEVRESNIPGAGLGVFTRVDLKKGLRLGEYLGKRLDPAQYARSKNSRYVFEIKINDVPVSYIDGRQLKTSNWTRYVNCPRSVEEENLMAVQEGTRIFFFAKRQVRAGEELLVWYGPAYGEWLLGRSQLGE